MFAGEKQRISELFGDFLRVVFAVNTFISLEKAAHTSSRRPPTAAVRRATFVESGAVQITAPATIPFMVLTRPAQ